MKFVALFIGISAPDRRRLLKDHWRGSSQPSSNDLGRACLKLMNRPEREFHYAPYDLLATFINVADEYFLHWSDSEFFIAKAIGWALRDITSFNPKAVQDFLQSHPSRNAVVRCEAERGLQRASAT